MPIDGGNGGLIARAWSRFRDQAPYDSPGQSGAGASDPGETPFHTLDWLIVKYVDKAISALANNAGTGSYATTTPVTGTDGVGLYTFSYSYSYNFQETAGGTTSYSLNDSDQFTYSFSEAGSVSGGSFNLADTGSDSASTVGTVTGTVTNALSGSDSYNLHETGVRTGGGAASLSTTATTTHSGSDLFSLAENRTDRGLIAFGSQSITWDESGADTSSFGGSETEATSDSATGAVSTLTTSLTGAGVDSHSLHLTGQDYFGYMGGSSYYNNTDLFIGYQNYTFDSTGTDTTSLVDQGTGQLASLPGGGAESESLSRYDYGYDSASLHQIGYRGYGDYFVSPYLHNGWHLLGTDTYTLNESQTDRAGGTDIASVSSAFGNDVASAIEQATTTLTGIDIGSITMELLAFNTQAPDGTGTLNDPTTWGQGDQTYTWYQVGTDYATTTEAGNATVGETDTWSSTVGNDVGSGTLTDWVTDSATATVTDGGTMTAHETGTETVGPARGVLNGTVTSTLDQTDNVFETSNESDSDTSTSVEDDTDTIGQEAISVHVQDNSTSGATANATAHPSVSMHEAGGLTLGAGGVAMGGVDSSTVSATDSGSDYLTAGATDIAYSTIDDINSIGNEYISASEDDAATIVDLTTVAAYPWESDFVVAVASFGVAGLVTSGSQDATATATDGATVIDAAVDDEDDTLDLIDTNSLAGSSTSSSEHDQVAVDQTINSVEYPADTARNVAHLVLGTGGAVTGGGSTLGETATVTGGVTATGSNADDATLDEVDENSLGNESDSETIHGDSSVTLSVDDTYTNWASRVDSLTVSLGAGGVVTGGSDSSTGDATGTATPDETAIAVASETTSGNARAEALGDSVTIGFSDSSGSSATVVTTGSSQVSTHDAAALVLGAGGLIASGVADSTEDDTGSVTSSETDEGSSSSDESDTETLALSNLSSSMTATDHSSDTNSGSGVATTSSGRFESIGLSFGAGGTVAFGTVTSTGTDTGHNTATRTETAAETVSVSGFVTYSEVVDGWKISPTYAETSSLTATVTVGDAPTSSLSTELTLGAGGTIAGGFVFASGSDPSGEHMTEHESDGETASGGASLSYAFAPSYRHTDQSNLDGTAQRVFDLTASSPSTTDADIATVASTLTLGLGGVIAGGTSGASSTATLNTTSSETVTTTLSPTETLGTQYLTYTPTPLFTISVTATDTATATDTGSETDWELSSLTLGSLGSILAGSSTLTTSVGGVETSSDSGQGPETTNDTSYITPPKSKTGTLSTSGAGGAGSQALTVTASVLGAGGSIVSGSVTYTEDASTNGATSSGETGSMTFIDEAQYPVTSLSLTDTASFTSQTTSTESLSTHETGTLTLGAGGSVLGGSDGFTWDQYASTSAGDLMTGPSVTITDATTDTFSQHETGQETLGAGATIVGGSDSFTWSQGGTDSYHLTQAGTDSYSLTQAGYGSLSAGTDSFARSYTLSYDDYTSSNWRDLGGDSLGTADSIVAGYDSYTWDKLGEISSSYVDRYAHLSYTVFNQTFLPTSRTVTESGVVSESASFHDVGSDALSGGTVTGSDSFTNLESHSDTGTAHGVLGPDALYSAYTAFDYSFGSDHYLDDWGTRGDDASGTSHDTDTYSMSDGYSYNFSISASHNFGYIDNSEATESASHSFNAQGSAAIDGTVTDRSISWDTGAELSYSEYTTDYVNRSYDVYTFDFSLLRPVLAETIFESGDGDVLYESYGSYRDSGSATSGVGGDTYNHTVTEDESSSASYAGFESDTTIINLSSYPYSSTHEIGSVWSGNTDSEVYSELDHHGDQSSETITTLSYFNHYSYSFSFNPGGPTLGPNYAPQLPGVLPSQSTWTLLGAVEASFAVANYNPQIGVDPSRFAAHPDQPVSGGAPVTTQPAVIGYRRQVDSGGGSGTPGGPAGAGGTDVSNPPSIVPLAATQDPVAAPDGEAKQLTYLANAQYASGPTKGTGPDDPPYSLGNGPFPGGPPTVPGSNAPKTRAEERAQDGGKPAAPSAPAREIAGPQQFRPRPGTPFIRGTSDRFIYVPALSTGSVDSTNLVGGQLSVDFDNFIRFSNPFLSVESSGTHSYDRGLHYGMQVANVVSLIDIAASLGRATFIGTRTLILAGRAKIAAEAANAARLAEAANAARLAEAAEAARLAEAAEAAKAAANARLVPKASVWDGLPLRSNARGLGEAAAGSYVESRIPVTKDLPDGFYKFVIDKNGRAWVAPTSELELPHSALVPKGEQVRGAGYIAVKNGRANVNGHSGHYMADRPVLGADVAPYDNAIRTTFREHGIEVINHDSGTGRLLRPPQ